MLGPRIEGVLDLDHTFMSMAVLAAQRSKDPNTQVGACLVDKDNRIIGTGYNGFPRGIPSDVLPWDRDKPDPVDNKYLHIGHAEENAVDNCDRTRIYKSKMYCTLHPCNKCAIRIIQNQIDEVIYLSDKYHDLPEFVVARKLFVFGGVKTRLFVPSMDIITVDLRANV